MNQQDKEHLSHEDEINLYDYWKVIVKRKRLIIGLFLVSVIFTVVVSLLMPKIYRGEAIIVITAKEVIDVIGKLDGDKRKTVFPRTSDLITDFRMSEIKGSTDKIKFTIESRSLDNMVISIAEGIEYINNLPIVRQAVERQKELLQIRRDELLKLIDDFRKLSIIYNELMNY